MLSYMSECRGKVFFTQNIHDTCTNTNLEKIKYFHWIFLQITASITEVTI